MRYIQSRFRQIIFKVINIIFISCIADPLHAHSSSTAEKKYKPMDPEKNFKSLGKLMKDFDKKDRKNCKKV